MSKNLNKPKRNKKDPAVVGAEVARRPGPAPRVWTLETVKSRCTVDGDCWIWSGKLTRGRDPNARIGGGTRSVARWVLGQALGREVRGDHVAQLRCHNPHCVSPRCVREVPRALVVKASLAACKLRLVRSDSTRAKNREHARALGWFKLADAQVEQIRALEGGKSVAEVALQFSVSTATVRGIWSGKRRALVRPSVAGSSVFSWRPAA